MYRDMDWGWLIHDAYPHVSFNSIIYPTVGRGLDCYEQVVVRLKDFVKKTFLLKKFRTLNTCFVILKSSSLDRFSLFKF